MNAVTAEHGREPDKRVTVIMRMRALGIKLSKRDRWAVGAMVRDRWAEQTGQLPQKELRKKTSGHGSHCFAIYPAKFQPVIDDILAQFGAQKDQQQKLFDDD